MEEAKKAERAKVMSLRAYPENISFFKELTEQHENQQRAFKALCEKYQGSKSDFLTKEDFIKEISFLNDKLTEEKQNNHLLKEKINELQYLLDDSVKTGLQAATEVEKLKNQQQNPLLIELTIENAQALRKVRKWLTARAVFKTDNYPAEATNLAVKYLLNQEFKNYL